MLGIAAGNAATAWRLIADGVADGQIAPYDPAAGKRFMRYVPFWADRRGDSL